MPASHLHMSNSLEVLSFVYYLYHPISYMIISDRACVVRIIKLNAFNTGDTIYAFSHRSFRFYYSTIFSFFYSINYFGVLYLYFLLMGICGIIFWCYDFFG